MLISPSILAADFSALAAEVARVSSADMLHIDVMDGHFVPNLTLGPPVVASLRDKTPLPFDVHLMLARPASFVAPFRKAGADDITVHVECDEPLTRLIPIIIESGARPGVAINPDTPVSALAEALAPLAPETRRAIYKVIVMTVRPGFGGQSLIPAALENIPAIRALLPNALIELDGGVNLETAPLCSSADILVAGTAIFRSPSPSDVIEQLRKGSLVMPSASPV